MIANYFEMQSVMSLIIQKQLISLSDCLTWMNSVWIVLSLPEIPSLAVIPKDEEYWGKSDKHSDDSDNGLGR
jgi:hypothetical protein